MSYDIGKELKYHREVNGYTQIDLAKATGISQQKISYIESGKHSPSIDICIKLADFYGISIDELVGRDLPDLKGN